jgi:starvation-inducible outer membrane lipoprotein
MRASLKGAAIVLVVGSVLACATPAPFPPSVMKDVAPSFHFEAWKEASPSNNTGKSDAGMKVQLGGRIIQAGANNGSGVLIVAEQLPIVQHPVYGPAETAKRTGDYEFAVVYPGQLNDRALRNGNRFIVVGTTKGRKSVVVDGAPKTEPFLVADCIHIWETGRSEIASFKESSGGGYSPLPEQTYCVKPK